MLFSFQEMDVHVFVSAIFVHVTLFAAFVTAHTFPVDGSKFCNFSK